MRILVVEDEPEMARLLEQSLTESGYEVSVATNGADGLKKADGQDLLVADVMMPGMDGFEMVRRLRSVGSRTPVIFLTAKGGTPARVEGLDLGGDDYIVKPFKLAELLARIRAQVRRTAMNSAELEYLDVHINCLRREVRRGGRSIDFSSTEFRVLEVLLRNAEKVVPKTTLLHEVWDDDGYRDDNLVEVYVRYVRTKLEVGGAPRLIHTLRGQGYVLSGTPPKP